MTDRLREKIMRVPLKKWSLSLFTVILAIGGIALFKGTAWAPTGWLTGWNYRSAVVIHNPGASPLSDYQVLVAVNTKGLYEALKLKSGAADIRFTASDGTTLLPYWIEDSDPNTKSACKIWVKVVGANVIPVAGDYTMYMYYGNSTPPASTLANNGTNTFEFFDDFESGSFNSGKWPTVGASSSVNTTHPYSGTYSAYYGYGGLRSNVWGTLGNKYELQFRHYDTGAGSRCEEWTGFIGSSGGADFRLAWGYTAGTYAYLPGFIDTGVARPGAGNWAKIKLIYAGGTTNYYSINDAANLAVTGNAGGVDALLFGQGWGNDAGATWIDDVRVRKYASPEPTTAVYGEQTNITHNYYKSIPITNPMMDNLLDHQVLITLDTAALITAGHMQSTCADIRFSADPDNYNEKDWSVSYPYLIESGINTTSTKIWVKVDKLTAGSTKTIYIYYGNPSAATASSFENTRSTASYSYNGNAGLVGEWRMEESSASHGSTIADTSGQANTGTLYTGDGATNKITNGKYGNAMTFDGLNDYVSYGTSSSLKITNSLTIEAWIKPSVAQSSHILYADAGTGSDIYFLDYSKISSGKVRIGYWDASTNTIARYTSSDIPLNEWTHVAGVRNADNTLDIYVNGQLNNGVLFGTPTSMRTNAPTIVTTGRVGNVNSEYFAGTIDEVRIYNRALTQTEITAHYLGRKYAVVSLTGAPSGAEQARLAFNVTDPDLTYTASVCGTNKTMKITAIDSAVATFTTYSPASTVSVTKLESGGSITNSATLVNPRTSASSNTSLSLAAADFTNGVATISLTDTELENVSVTAIDQTTASVAGTSIPVTFNYGAPYKITLTAPASLNAGQVSTVFTATLKNSCDNITNATVATGFSLATTSLAGSFYSDSAATTAITTLTIPAGSNSATFYYKDTTAGLPRVTVARTSGDALTQGSVYADVTLLPVSLDHFAVTAPVTTLAAGGSRTITITAYDVYGNTKTNLNSDLALVFSGADASASPSNSSPTCSNKLSSDINFGLDTSLTFTNGIATTTLKLYKAQAVLIKATSGAVTTSNAQALGFTVMHNIANHLRFTGNITGVTAGSALSLGALNAVDLYDNLCDGANGGTAYSGLKTIGYTLSTGLANAPDGSMTDSWPTTVTFTTGVSAATLSATLYRAQSATITASDGSLAGTGIPSNSVTIQAGPVAKLSFYQQPSTAPFTNAALPQQPKVAVADQYGNPNTVASDQITLTASLTSGSYTAVTNGTLTAALVTTSGGLANFSGVKYSYPENIYLIAHSGSGFASDVYSYQVVFKTAADSTISAGPLAEPANISSVASTDSTKVQIFDFKVTDAGTDGYATSLKQIAIARDSLNDTTGGWQNYIAAAVISDGTTSTVGTVTNDVLTFGSGNSTIYAVADGQNKTFTLSIYLNQLLPAGADGKAIAFTLNPNSNITAAALGSAFATASAMSNSLAINVIPTKFIVTGSSSTVAAAGTTTLTIKAIDSNGNLASSSYSGDKEIIFSGANPAISGGTTYSPTCTNFSGGAISFGNVTMVTFANGQNSSTVTMKLYKAESAVIKAATSNSTITTSTADAFNVTVSGGAPSKLSWITQPVSKVAASAPWNQFKLSVSDLYGNTTSSAINVTVAPSSAAQGSVVSGGTVAAQSGVATFANFAVTCPSYPGTVTLNATGPGVSASDNSNSVTVDEKYNIKMNVLDSANGGALTELTLKVIDANTGQLVSGMASNPILGNSPLIFSLPYGTCQFAFTKSAYVDTTIQKTADVPADAVDGAYDNSIVWTFYITSVTESQADYKVLSNFIYDETNDKITALVSLEKRGKHIVNDDISTLKTATLNIFDSSDAVTPIYTGSLAGADANGNYYFYIANAVAKAGFASGKSYFAKMTVLYGGADLSRNTTYSVANAFNISVSQALKSLSAQIQSAVSAEAAVTRAAVQSESSTIQSKVSEVKTAAASILTATGTESLPTKITTAQEAVTSKITTDVQPYVKSAILNRENAIKTGDTITVRYRTVTGKSPTVTIYDPKNVIRISAAAMTEVGATGVYEYTVKFVNGWGTGEFTIVCSESTQGTVDAQVISVTRHDIEEVSGQVSAVLGSTSGITGLKSVTDTIGLQFNDMDKLLAKISKDVASKLGEAKSAVNDLAGAFKQLEDMSKQIKNIGGTKGINLEKLYEVSKDKKEDITYIKNKSEELKAAMELNQKMIENVAKKPVVQTWFEFK